MTKPSRSEASARRKLRYRVESASLAIGSALESARALCEVVPHEGDTCSAPWRTGLRRRPASWGSARG